MMLRCIGSGAAQLALLSSICIGSVDSRLLQRKERPTSYRQTLHNYQNVQYYADFDIGGQNIAGIFDTGSFELLVRSSRCGDCAHPTAPYDRLKSKTYKKDGKVTKHVFGSGPCVSMMGSETVSVGPMKAPDQTFWEIIAHRIPVLDQAKFAAIVGIGPNFAYGNKEKTLLMNYGVEEFSVCLKKETGANGYLNWGPEPKPVKPSQRATAQVIGKHHWAARLSDVKFAQPKDSTKAIEIPCSGGNKCTAIVDSGTSLIAAPGVALMQLSEHIPPINEDCSNLHELPPLHFNIGGTDFVLPPQAYVFRVTGATMEANDVWDILFFKPKIRKLNMCMPAFMQLDMMSSTGPVWILGMPFFRYFHTTFDRANKEMHFTVAGPDCESLPFKDSANSTQEALIAQRSVSHAPLDVHIDAIVPPTLSGMMDYPFETNGEIDL